MATGTLVDVVMPQMGVSVSEGTITKWAKSEGEPIEADETLLEISTDKVDTEVPSPASGIVQQILVQEGETVEVGTKIAVIAPEGAAASEPSAAPEAPADEAPPEAPDIGLPEPATQEAAAESAALSSAEGETPAAAPVETPAPAAPTAVPEGQENGGARFVSPVVARIAAEHGVDVSQVSGTGRGGRGTKNDILGFIGAGGATAPPEAPARAEAAPAPQVPAAPAEPEQPLPATAPAPVAAHLDESVEPMSAMRKGIAEHMRRSLDTSAHVTSAIEVDMSKVAAIRQTLKKDYQAA